MGKIDTFATVIAEHLPAVAARIPPTPAATLGHLPPEPTPTTVAEALRPLGPSLAERLLGALELRLDDLPTDAHGLVRRPQPANGTFTLLSSGNESETATAVAMLDALHPGLTNAIADLVDRLTRHPTLAHRFDPPPTSPAITTPRVVVPMPFTRGYARPVPPTVGDDETAARARHTPPRAGLITAHAVLRELDAATPAAVVGTALGITALHLPRFGRPAALTEATRARLRAETGSPRRPTAKPRPVTATSP